MKLVVEEGNIRIDKYLVEKTDYSRSKIQKLIKDGNILVNNKKISANYNIKLNDEIIINDNEDILPQQHKKDFEPGCLPKSLKNAIRCFIIARAIRLVRGQLQKNHTMMINVSRFIRVQELVKGLVLEYVKEIRQSVNNYSSQNEEVALRNPLIHDLYITW